MDAVLQVMKPRRCWRLLLLFLLSFFLTPEALHLNKAKDKFPCECDMEELQNIMARLENVEARLLEADNVVSAQNERIRELEARFLGESENRGRLEVWVIQN